MTQVINWKCDRCDTKEAVKDQFMPKTNTLPAGWSRLVLIGRPLGNQDLCSSCTDRALAPEKA